MKDQNRLPTAATITRTPFPGSKKIYVHGELNSIEVAMREIETDDAAITKPGNGTEKHKVKITVYDSSGPYTDPELEINVHDGLKPIRREWILKRDDVEELSSFSSMYANERISNGALNPIHFKNIRKPLRAKQGSNVSQMHYARVERSLLKWNTLLFVKTSGTMNQVRAIMN